jgi:preprotein translocase subunit SecB
VPNAPEIFLEREQPQVEIQLNTGGVALAMASSKSSDRDRDCQFEDSVFLVEVARASSVSRTCRMSNWSR